MKKLLSMLTTLIFTFLFVSCIDEDVNFDEEGAGADVMSYSMSVMDEPYDANGGPGRGKGMCRKGRGGMGPWMVLKALDLSDEQWVEVKGKMKDCRKKCYPPKGEELSFEEMKLKHKAMRDSMITCIKPILSEEQLAKLNAIMEKLDNGEVPDELINGKLAYFADKLELTGDQQAAIKEIFASTMKQMMEAKEAAQDRESAHSAMREIHQATREKIAAVLTEEQMALFKEMRAEKKGKWGKKCHPRKHGKGMKDCQRGKW